MKGASRLDTYLAALIGGIVIGLSAGGLLLLKGRVFGISGILGGLIRRTPDDVAWRVAIILGLMVGGALAYSWLPESFPRPPRSMTTTVMAGLLVGFGTQMGGGCTSGHGVCGISRFSLRSIVATGTFMAAGIVTVWLFNQMAPTP